MARRGGKSLGLLGIVGAAAAWYFLDPKRGADRRERFVTGARKAYDNAGTELKKLGNEASKGLSVVVDRTGEIARQGLEKVSDASHSAAENAKKMSERARTRVEESDTVKGLAQVAEDAVDKVSRTASNVARKVSNS